MGSNTNGFENESNLIDYLNGKRYFELNDNFKKFIRFIFGEVNKESKIKACSGKSGQKPDLIIEIDDVKKYVSVKVGTGNSVHQEEIEMFMNFLNTLPISEVSKIELLKFHWADGTYDGTGKIRVSSAEYKKEHAEEIKLINREVNKKEVLPIIINRVLFQGKSNLYEPAEYIYYGDINMGQWASKEEIINYILNNSFSNNSIHFVPLSYQIWNRCLNFNPNTEDRRNVMQIKWGSLAADLLIIESERNESE